MKILTFVFGCAILVTNSFSQNYDSPKVEWRVTECPHRYPNSPVFSTTSTDPTIQPGGHVMDFSLEYPYSKSGEDWWYSITPCIIDGIETGYYVSGYSSFLQYQYSEVASGGCKEFFPTPSDYNDPDEQAHQRQRPILGWNGEKLSAKLAAVSLYNKKGEMVWCRPYLAAHEGAISIKADSQGNTYFTGWTNTTRNIAGNAMTYNPTITNIGTTISGDVCNANGLKMVVAKVSPTGQLIWSHLYGMNELNVSTAPLVSQGLDLVIDNDGNVVVVGHSKSNIATTSSLFLVKLNQNGKIIKKTETSLLNHHTYARSISKYNNDFIVTGYAYEITEPLVYGSNDGITLKFNSNLEPILSSSFGFKPMLALFSTNGTSFTTRNVGTIFHENIFDVDGHRTNIDFDSKKLVNGNIAIVSLEDCSGGEYSGVNIGKGYLRIYNASGTSLDPIAHPNNEPILINQTTGSKYPLSGYIAAFDLKIGLEPDDENEITLVTSVKDGNINSPENAPIFAQSMAAISNPANPVSDPNQFIQQGYYLPRNQSNSFHVDMSQTSALVANYNINGLLKWEKIIDAKDEGLQVYPGDWKEQECVYQIMKDQEGAYIYVGNSSDNKDDYYLGKINSNCLLDISYDVKPVNPVVNNIVEVNGGIVHWNPTTWGKNDIYVRGEIHVKNGTTLNISGGLNVHFADGSKMDYDTKLIVEAGAKLIVNNSKLTNINDCPYEKTVWSGIEVWGNFNLSQSNANQGVVELNNSIVEFAAEAIQTWKPQDWSTTGGIVKAYNSTFRNNKRSISYLAYENVSQNTGNIISNQGIFSNCVFTSDDDYIEDAIFPHATLYRVRGVRFEGCDFKDDRSNLTLEKMNKGVFSIDAQYYVRGRNLGSVMSNPHHYYSTSNYDVGTFTNLHSGVEVMNGNANFPVTIDHNLFTDCYIGVRLSKVDNAIVTRNKFDRTTIENDVSRYGIHMEQCTDYHVEGNEFTASSMNNSTLCGVFIKQSGYDNNEVYKNKMKNNAYATFSSGKNRNDNGPLGGSNGLEYLCNQYVSSKFVDEHVLGANNLDGIRLVQGTPQVPARNEFSSSPQNGNIINTTNGLIHYYYSLSTPSQNPIIGLSGGVAKYSSTFSGSCPTSFLSRVVAGGSVFLNKAFKTNLENEHGSLTNEYTSLNDTLESLLSYGDRPFLHSLVESISLVGKSSTWDSLVKASPYLSVTLLSKLANHVPTHISHTKYKSLLVENQDVIRVDEFLADIEQKISKEFVDELIAHSSTVSQRTIKQGDLINIDRKKTEIERWMIRDVYADTTNFDLNSYLYWSSLRKSYLEELQLVDLHLSLGSKDSIQKHFDKILALSNKNKYLTNSLTDFIKFKKMMIDSTDAFGVLHGVSRSMAVVLRDYAENSSGYAQIQAQNILCFFLNECSLPDPLPASKSANFSTDYSDDVVVSIDVVQHTVFPNPNNGSFEVDVKELDIDAILLQDLNGKTILTISSEGRRLFNVEASTIPAGMYILQLQKGGLLIESSKIIKH